MRFPAMSRPRAIRPRGRLSTALLCSAIALSAIGCAGEPTGSEGPGPTGVATSHAPGQSGFALLGAWETSITKEDLAAGGIADPGLQNENSGRFIWTFSADGTWTQVQQSLDGSPLNSPVFRGTYTADGTSLVMVTEFPPEYRDSGLHFTWSFEGAAVRFDLLDPPDPTLPIVIERHAWTRSSQ